MRDTGARVRVIVVPDGKDPDEFIRKHGADAFRALVEKALPLVEYRLRYVLSHTNYDTLDGKVKALHEMMPVLAGIREAAVRSEYERRLAQTLMLDEGIVRSELRHYRPEAEEAQVRQPIRKVVAMRQELTMILCGCSARRISMPSTRSTAARRMNMRRTASMRPACKN